MYFIGNIILPDTTLEEWLIIRTRIMKRIINSMGESPVEIKPSASTTFEIIDEYENLGLIHKKIRYQVLDDEWNTGILVTRSEAESSGPIPAVLTIHGTNGELGKYGMLGRTENRDYGIELAQRGFATFSVDQYGYGETICNRTDEEIAVEFYKKYPKWSITGRRLLDHVRALDVLDQIGYIKSESYGVLGHSLGGLSSHFVAAMDYRIQAAVVSAGLSPYICNIHRLMKQQQVRDAIPIVTSEGEKGTILWDNHELAALCAPKAILYFEPFFDPCNPSTLASFHCVYESAKVYKLLGISDRYSITIHSNGHDTVKEIREQAYRWLENFLDLQE